MAGARGTRRGRRARTAAVAGTCLVLLPLASVLATVRTASADEAAIECAGVTSWSFSTVLDEGFRSGTITANYVRTVCAGASDIAGRPWAGVADARAWSVSYAFAGSCVLTAFTFPYDPLTGTSNGSGLLVGGTVALITTGSRANGLTELAELAPSTPCDETSALGSAQFTIAVTPRIMG